MFFIVIFLEKTSNGSRRHHHNERFLKHTKNVVSYQSITNYLKSYLKKVPKTYNSQITVLRRFIRDFLGAGELISSFKKASVDAPKRFTNITKAQVRAGFHAQSDTRSKALYLFTATTGFEGKVRS